MNHQYYEAVRNLFHTYCLGIAAQTVLDPPRPGKKLSFCFSDVLYIDPRLEARFLAEQLPFPPDQKELEMAYFRVGQEFFLRSQPTLLARSCKWMRFFDGDTLGEPQA